MLQKGHIAEDPIGVGRFRFVQRSGRQFVQQDREDQCPRIVVGGISLSTIGNGEDRVLQYSGIVGQCIYVIKS